MAGNYASSSKWPQISSPVSAWAGCAASFQRDGVTWLFPDIVFRSEQWMTLPPSDWRVHWMRAIIGGATKVNKWPNRGDLVSRNLISRTAGQFSGRRIFPPITINLETWCTAAAALRVKIRKKTPKKGDACRRARVTWPYLAATFQRVNTRRLVRRLLEQPAIVSPIISIRLISHPTLFSFDNGQHFWQLETPAVTWPLTRARSFDARWFLLPATRKSGKYTQRPPCHSFVDPLERPLNDDVYMSLDSIAFTFGDTSTMASIFLILESDGTTFECKF